MIKLVPIEPEYVYITIPAEYICVYHKILAMLADYGVEMLQDCKASCKDRNSNVIECFNMFNSAVAARKLGQDKLAETLIKYIKAKINQIYKGDGSKTSFVFPVDKDGNLKAFVSCGERPMFQIDPKDMGLYQHEYNYGFDEHFSLSDEDECECGCDNLEKAGNPRKLRAWFYPRLENFNGVQTICGDIKVEYNGVEINYNKCTITYYVDNCQVKHLADAQVSAGNHEVVVVVKYRQVTKVVTKIVKVV